MGVRLARVQRRESRQLKCGSQARIGTAELYFYHMESTSMKSSHNRFFWVVAAILALGSHGLETQAVAEMPAVEGGDQQAQTAETEAGAANGEGTPEGEATPNNAVAEKNLAAFDKVWETIQRSHWDPELGGVDWEAAREQLRPSLEAAADLATTRKAISQLLLRLGESHFGLIPAEFYERNAEASAGGGWSGITFRMLDGVPIVTLVAQGSPAANAGVPTGAEIKGIGDASITELTDLSEAGELDEAVAVQAIFSKIERALAGKLGEPVQVAMEDVDGERLTVEYVPTNPPGKVTKFGLLPEMVVDIETRMLADRVGYVRFTMFMDPSRLIGQIGEFIVEHPEMRGLIFDIRGNPGGIGGMAIGVSGWIAKEKQQSLGRMQTRTGELKFVFFKRPKSFTGPVAILVDDRSMSTAEIFPGGLQELGRCRIFGRRTPGMALPSIVEMLPNGDRFIHAIADYVLPSGTRLEGAGVKPDEVVTLDRRALAEGRDQDVEAATAWILQQSKSE